MPAPPRRFANFVARESKNLSSANNSSTLRVSPICGTCRVSSPKPMEDARALPGLPGKPGKPSTSGKPVATGVAGADNSIRGRFGLCSVRVWCGDGLVGEVGAAATLVAAALLLVMDCDVPGRCDCCVTGRDCSARCDCCVVGRETGLERPDCAEPIEPDSLEPSPRSCACSASSVAANCASSSSISFCKRWCSASLISCSSRGISCRCRMTSQSPCPAASSRTRSQRKCGISARTFLGLKRV
mmetsp:Transcript_17827/g.39312  ORF Transcript_17827/g.39312 Transcript_17827/m.39312 type:complete len:243 (-) Transcript_17827:273-1001(-)